MSGEKEEKIDPLSDQFDPLIALYSPNVKLPCESAPIYDNISKFEATTSGVTITRRKQATAKAETSVPPPKIPDKKITDGWDNVITRMEKVEGPLAVLRVCMERGLRIKVFTRKVDGVRGHITGLVCAFDKQWNIALEDVTEVWTRRLKKKSPLMGEQHCKLPQENHLRMTTPEIHTTKINGKTELCQRHVNKLMMRGEHVVFISILDY